MPTTTSPSEDALRESKRELFDGMRAYHESEISHANHAITMLLAVAAGAGAVVLAILFPQTASPHQNEIAWGLFVVVAVLSVSIAGTAHFKIGADHKIYVNFGAEYVKTSELLGFYAAIQIGNTHEALKKSRAIGQGTGYRKTQAIIWVFAGVVSTLTLAFAIALRYLTCALTR